MPIFVSLIYMNVIIQTILSFLKDEDYRNLLFGTFFVLGVGTVVYHYVENWPWIDALYFCVVTLTTIGYGDFTPQTTIGKLFTIGYIFVGIAIILTFINTVYMHYTSFNKKNKSQSS